MDAISSVKSATQATPAAAAKLLQASTDIKSARSAEVATGGGTSVRAESSKPAVTSARPAQPAKETKASGDESARVTLSQQTTPQPNTADRNAKPIEQFKAVSALR